MEDETSADAIGPEFARLLADGPALVREFVARAEAAGTHAQFVDARALATAAVTASGQLVAADENFRAWFGAAALDTRAIARALARGGIEGGLLPDREGVLAPIAWVGAVEPVPWYLPEPVQAALRSRRAAAAIVGIDSARAHGLHGDVARAFRLSPAEARLAGALIAHGDLRTAAADCGVGYETARERLASAMRKVGVRAQPALLARLLERAIGVWRADVPDIDASAASLLGLSRRQVRVALAVAQGATRDEAAAQAGVSAAVAKDELARVYATLGISGVTQLARCLTDTLALVSLVRSEAGERHARAPAGEATGFLPRPGGGCVAFTDHGPAAGAPVLLVHGTGTTRHAARSLVRALQAAGLRPIAIDRPGFGQSDMVVAADPFRAAADDMLLVCEALKLPRVRVLARGSVAVVLAFAQIAAARLARVVLVNPGLPVAFDAPRAGPLALVRRALYRHPGALQLVARLLTRPASAALMVRGLRHNLADSPPDLAVLDDAEEVEDFWRATRLMTTGTIEGYLAEHAHYGAGWGAGGGAGWLPVRIPDARHWTLVSGAHDPLHDPVRSHAYWRGVLVGARCVELPDAGRFLHVSHAARLAELLLR